MTDLLRVVVEKFDGYAIVHTDGYINNLGGEKIAQACRELVDQGMRRCILNLHKSPGINSVGISFIIEAIEHIDGAGGVLACCGLTPTVSKTFHIMRLTGATTIYDTQAEAVAAIKKEA